jgi:hypothetical protein
MSNEKDKLLISAVVLFWITFASFLMMIAGMYFNYIFFAGFISFSLFMIILAVFGIALIVLAKMAEITKISKVFFILTGASAIGMGLSVLLHNLIYAVLIKILGGSAWAKTGDEPVFFILATIVCPIALLVGVIGIIVLLARRKIRL